MHKYFKDTNLQISYLPANTSLLLILMYFLELWYSKNK